MIRPAHEIARCAHRAGRRRSLLEAVQIVETAADVAAAAAAIAFLDGCEFAGAHMDDFDEERAEMAMDRSSKSSRRSGSTRTGCVSRR